MTTARRAGGTKIRAFSSLGGSGWPKRSKTTQNTGSALERALEASLNAAGVTGFVREFHFHPTRKWRVDFAFPRAWLAVEVEGGIYRGGGHTTVTGIKRDIDKANALTMMGWRLLRFHADQVTSGEATETIRRALDLDPAPTGEEG